MVDIATYFTIAISVIALAPLKVQTVDKNTIEVVIGGLFDSKESVEVFNEAVLSSPKDMGSNGMKIKFKPITKLMSTDSVQSADEVCEIMKEADGNLVSLVVSYPETRTTAPPLAASFTASYYDIPILSVSARHSFFSDKFSHKTFLRTVPPYNQEAQIFARIINKFEWKDIIVLYDTGDEGETFLSQLKRASEDEQFKVKTEISIDEGPIDIWEKDRNEKRISANAELDSLNKKQTRAIVLYASRESAKKLFTKPNLRHLFGEGWAWLVSEDVMRMDKQYLPLGIVGINCEIAPLPMQIRDAVRVIKNGIMEEARRWNNSGLNITKDCYRDFMEEDGAKERNAVLKKIREVISRSDNRGETGQISFDRRGDREQANYSVVNVIGLANGSIDIINVGNCSLVVKDSVVDLDYFGPVSTINMTLDMSKLKWPGNYTRTEMREYCVGPAPNRCSKKTKKKVYLAPISFKKKTLLRVVTQESIPFVYKRPLTPDRPCDESENPNEYQKEVKCSHTDPDSNNVTYYCCYGYNIDLLRQLATRPNMENLLTPFTYTVHLVGDGKIGQDMGGGQWNGIVNELIKDKADLAVAPMSITPQRAARIEFTKPFKYLGLTILVKRSLPKSNLVSFLQPFDYTLWVLVFLSVHVVTLVLYLLDRFSPFGRFKLANSSDTEEDALNLASAMWFAWGVLLNSGIGEGTPRSFSARVLGMVWAGFAMIIVASYTANLAAFLVLDRPEALISGIDDARMRYPTKDFLFATVKNSTVEQFFKKRLEYATMYRTMEQHTYHTVQDAIEAVKNRKLNAFIWDSARLNFEASSDCELMTAGEVFGRFGYGLAMKMGSPWLREMSQAVLNFHELGVMEMLDSKWILSKAKGCPPTNSLSPATLGLTNMAGVFIMVAAGIVAGVFLIFIEMAYKKRTGMKERELELVKSATDRWRGNIERRKVLRRGRTASNYGDLTPSNGGSPNAMYATSNLTEHVSLDHKGSMHQFET